MSSTTQAPDAAPLVKRSENMGEANPEDFTTGMQPGAASSAIGRVPISEQPQTGQDIGLAFDASYFADGV